MTAEFAPVVVDGAALEPPGRREQGGLDRPSWVITEQPRTLSRDRLTGVAGEVSTDCPGAVRTWLGDFLDL